MDTLKKVLNVLVVLIAIVGLIFLFISISNDENDNISQNKRIIDSLRNEILKNERCRDSLTSVIKKLDIEIQDQERIIDSLTKRKPTPLPTPVPPPKPSEARDVLDKFRKG